MRNEFSAMKAHCNVFREVLMPLVLAAFVCSHSAFATTRPNILFAIADEARF
jgi:hypothetical protein